MKTHVKSWTSIIVIALCICTLHLGAQPTIPAPVGPTAKIEFEKSTHDFGEIESGEIVSQVFTFTNTSDKPLILIDAKGSCGCTVPQWPRELIAPGETASLTVEFNSKNKLGKRKQRVTLTANTDPPQTFIYLTGDVLPSNDADPKVIEIEGEATQATIDPDCFAIYPNPTAELLKLEVEERNLGQSAIVAIYSKTGQLMAKREIKAIDGTLEFNVAHYPAGTYIAHVQIGDRKPEARCFVVVD